MSRTASNTCFASLQGFGARCQGRNVVFTTRPSQEAQSNDGALGVHSPIHTFLQRCCHSAGAFDFRKIKGKIQLLAYDVDTRTGILKWLGPVYQTENHLSSNSSHDSSESSFSDSSESSFSDSSESSSWSSSRKKKPRRARTATVRKAAYRVANVLPGKVDRLWSEDDLPKYWIQPFGTLLQEKRQPSNGDFGVAFVAHRRRDGSVKKLLMFGQVVGIKDGRYRFLTPNLENPDQLPGEYLLNPQRFAPVYIDPKRSFIIPKVAWSQSVHEKSPVPKAADKKDEHPAVPKAADKKEEHPAVPKAADKKEEHPADLTEKLKVRFNRAARKCNTHMEAKHLLEAFRQNLLSVEKKRRDLLEKPEKEKELLNAYQHWNHNREVFLRRLAVAKELLSKVEPDCTEAIAEVLAQEESDQCRKWVVDHAIESENAALREVIEHGTEEQARRAIVILLAPYEDAAAREKNEAWIAAVRHCSAKIKSPLERSAPLPDHDVEEIKKGQGFGDSTKRMLRERCRKSKVATPLEALLQRNKIDEKEWEEIIKVLQEEEADLSTFWESHRCRKEVEKLLQATQPMA